MIAKVYRVAAEANGLMKKITGWLLAEVYRMLAEVPRMVAEL
jgi:hypothetical protein